MAPKTAVARKIDSSDETAPQTPIKFEATVQSWGFEPEEFRSSALDERFKKQVIYTNERGEERVMNARIARWHGDGFVHVVFNMENNDEAWRWESDAESLDDLIAPLGAHLKTLGIDKKPTRQMIERIQELTRTRAARIQRRKENQKKKKW